MKQLRFWKPQQHHQGALFAHRADSKKGCCMHRADSKKGCCMHRSDSKKGHHLHRADSKKGVS